MEELLNDYGWAIIVVFALVVGFSIWKKGGFKVNE